MTAGAPPRRLPVGAELIADGEVSFRVWAPDRRRLRVVVDGTPTELVRDPAGYFGGTAAARAGSRYGLLADDERSPLPDPASRAQPDGPEGFSEVVDPDGYRWSDAQWPGPDPSALALYELHVGTFTPAGTWRAAAERLPDLHDLGVTAVLMMPVAEFSGQFGWGYDGVGWFAPSHLYGRPDDLRHFVDHAHAVGLGVILDVVYNHLGPRGNYLATFASAYFTDRYENEWGDALNFDGAGAAAVRAHVLANVTYWIREFHVDGFRLDAVQQMYDQSPEHIVAELTRRARDEAAPRRVVLIGENEPQTTRFIRPPDQGGYGLDGLYNDDFQRSARVRLTGIREAYYSDYRGTAEELLAVARRGFLFQGQRSGWQQKPRGTPALDRPSSQFVCFLENHDQVANSTRGARLSELAAPGQLRALTALLLLMPTTPMLFQGQEYGTHVPFVYFADYPEPLAGQVRHGRTSFLAQFPRMTTSPPPDPAARQTFEACRLRQDAAPARACRFWLLHRALLEARRPLLGQGLVHVDGATLSPDVLLLRYFREDGTDRLLIVNLGTDIQLHGCAEPLLAPPDGRRWRLAWSSEDVAYGGSGTPPLSDSQWMAPGHAATITWAAPADGRVSAPEPKR